MINSTNKIIKYKFLNLKQNNNGSNENYEFTFLMPCLNEEKTIEMCIDEAKRFINENDLNAEILIADNGSEDSSVEKARKAGARVIHVNKKGYGMALRAGIKASKGKYIIMGDADMSYDFYHVDDFVKYLRDGYKMVIGNRFNGDMEKGAMPGIHKYFGVPMLSLLGRLAYKTNVGDFHCGLRGVERDAAINMKFASDGMEFASEMIGKFAKAGYEIKEVPINLRKDKRNGKSHIRTFRDGFRHVAFILFNKI